MRLAFCLFKYFPYGGLQRDFLRIALECQRRGHTIDVYTMEWQGDIPQELNVTLIPTQGIWNHRRALSFAKQLPTYLKNKSYDLVVGFNKIPGLDVYYAADPCYVAKTHNERSILYRLTGRYRTYAKLEKIVFSADQKTEILLLAEEQQTQFINYHQTQRQRFHLLPPNIDRHFIRPLNAEEIRKELRQELQITTDSFCVLMVGSSFKTKGVDRALQAIHALPDDLRQQTYLMIVGAGDAQPFLRLAQALKISKQVKFLGGRDDVAQLLLAADVLLHPAYSENTGTVLLEALSSGLPVLTTEACGYAKHIQHARAGCVLTLPFQQAELNKQLSNILSSAQLRAAWQKNAMGYAAKTDLYSMVEKAADLLESFTKTSSLTSLSTGFRSIHDRNDVLESTSSFPLGSGNPEHKDVNINISIEKVFQLKGEFFRQHKNRETLRVTLNNQYYFLKRHGSIGWREIIKNLLQLHLPVVSAEQEWLAIQKLTELNIPTTPLVAYGKQGKNPATLQSFILTNEITNTISLEDFCRNWPQQPPSPELKRKLIIEVARIARTLHSNGINHRDFYLCHLLLDKNYQEKLKIYVIDLHRAQCRTRTPQHAIIKDLAGLYFSSLDIGLNKRDLLRFIKHYTICGSSFSGEQSETRESRKKFWQKINKRALRLYGKIEKKTLKKIATLTSPIPTLLACTNTDNLLYCEQLVRVIPNKRWVFFAQWNQQLVVAKIFSKARHAMRELEGYQALIDADIATPHIVFHDWSRGGNFYILLYEYLPAAKNVSELTDLLLVVAQHHKMGIKQRDLHFNNFLVSNNQIYTLDTATVVKCEQPLETRQSLKNLALLFAQLPPNYDFNLEEHYRLYLQACSLPFTLAGLTELNKWIAHWHKQRLRVYGKKVFRSSTALIAQHSWQQFSVCDRSYDTEAMQIFLADPEAVLQGPAVKFLKRGHSSTVALINISGHQLVIKRYNIKNFWHGIRRALRNTRAAISWRNAHCLSLMDIPTAKPVAMVEKRFGPFRSTSYFISEYVTGTALQNHFKEMNSIEEQMFSGEKVMALFKRLADLHISHGDLKATNILMIGTQPLLIDLDAMHLHRSTWRWRKAQQRDHKRFLKNWEEEPELKKIFDAR